MTRENINLANLFRDDTPIVQDVTMDEPRKTAYRAPYARTDLKCGECGATMILRKSAKYKTQFYGCSKFPDCKGAHGAHPDGRPKGNPADRRTNEARIRAHEIFDLVWKEQRLTRAQAYAWVAKAMKLSAEAAHISQFSYEQCEELIKHVERRFPGLRSVWQRILDTVYDPNDIVLFDEEDDV